MTPEMIAAYCVVALEMAAGLAVAAVLYWVTLVRPRFAMGEPRVIGPLAVGLGISGLLVIG